MIEIVTHDSATRLAAGLLAADQRRVVVAALRAELRRPLPAVRRAVRATALRQLPHRGGLGAWVAAARIGATVRATARTVTARIHTDRASLRGRSDLAAIDRGRVRAPAWGNRTAWHTQRVAPGYFTRTVTVDAQRQWLDAARDAARIAAREISRA
jgi:hypothetical protein